MLQIEKNLEKNIKFNFLYKKSCHSPPKKKNNNNLKIALQKFLKQGF